MSTYKEIGPEIRKEWEWTWHRRFSDFLRFSQVTFRPSSADAIYHAAGIRPAHLLKLDLNQMTLAEWSELLLLALKDELSINPNYTPLWMAVPALYRLGLGACLPILEKQFENNEFQKTYQQRGDSFYEDAKSARFLLSQSNIEQVEPSRDFVGLLVAKPESSMLKKWKPSSRHGGLVVDMTKFSEFESSLGLFFKFIFPEFLRMLILYEVDDQTPGQMLDIRDVLSRLSLLSRSQWVFYLVSRSTREFKSNQITIRDPKNFDDAMERALRFLREAPPSMSGWNR